MCGSSGPDVLFRYAVERRNGETPKRARDSHPVSRRTPSKADRIETNLSAASSDATHDRVEMLGNTGPTFS